MVKKSKNLEHVGYIKYQGKDVQSGVIDAGSAGNALLGLDEALRFFNTQQSPDLATLQYDIPIKTQEGSWEAVVLGGLVATGGAFALGYAKKAGEKLAENDFKEIGLKDVFKKSISAIKTLAQLVKHTRKSHGWEVAHVRNDSKQPHVAVLDDNGRELLIPAEFFTWYSQMPPRLLVRMTSVVKAERVLSIGLSEDSTNEAVSISEVEKLYFESFRDEDVGEESLFPELIHGKAVTLEGRLIRGNEASNSIGLEYLGHVINCIPSKGSIRQYKPALFLRCKVSGRINRLTKSRFVADRRPTLIIEKVMPQEKDSQGSLFDF
jgi:hypothetical protein